MIFRGTPPVSGAIYCRDCMVRDRRRHHERALLDKNSTVQKIAPKQSLEKIFSVEKKSLKIFSRFFSKNVENLGKSIIFEIFVQNVENFDFFFRSQKLFLKIFFRPKKKFLPTFFRLFFVCKVFFVQPRSSVMPAAVVHQVGDSRGDY